MSYSASDFVDDVLQALAVRVPPRHRDNPAAQANLAIAAIRRLREEAQTAVVLVTQPEVGAVRELLSETVANTNGSRRMALYRSVLAKLDHVAIREDR